MIYQPYSGRLQRGAEISKKNQPPLKQNESRTQNPIRDCPHKGKRIQVKN